MPDKEEQKEICNYVETVSSDFNHLVGKEKNAIKLLNELAENTIASIATGQIRI